MVFEKKVNIGKVYDNDYEYNNDDANMQRTNLHKESLLELSKKIIIIVDNASVSFVILKLFNIFFYHLVLAYLVV